LWHVSTTLIQSSFRSFLALVGVNQFLREMMTSAMMTKKKFTPSAFLS